MGIEWRFDAGGPIHASPAVGAEGSVYVGTADGYVLALDPQGRVVWSYTLEGAVAWAPLVDRSGRLYVATTAQRLCSFQPNGALGWQVRTPAHVAGELVLGSPSGALFAGTDGNVWAYNEYGTPLWHAAVGAPISAGPRLFGSHVVVGSTDGRVLEFEGTLRRGTFDVHGACDAIVGARPDGSATILVEGALLDVGPKGEVLFRRDGVEWAESLDGGFLAIERGGMLTRLTSNGDVASTIPVGTEASAPPVVTSSGVVYVAGASGTLSIARQNGVVRHIPIASSALHRPVLDLARRRVLVTAGSGIVASLHLED
jgi:hypothetical protein